MSAAERSTGSLTHECRDLGAPRAPTFLPAPVNSFTLTAPLLTVSPAAWQAGGPELVAGAKTSEKGFGGEQVLPSLFSFYKQRNTSVPCFTVLLRRLNVKIRKKGNEISKVPPEPTRLAGSWGHSYL